MTCTLEDDEVKLHLFCAWETHRFMFHLFCLGLDGVPTASFAAGRFEFHGNFKRFSGAHLIQPHERRFQARQACKNVWEQKDFTCPGFAKATSIAKTCDFREFVLNLTALKLHLAQNW